MNIMKPTQTQSNEELAQEALAEDPGNYFEGPRLVCSTCGERLTFIDGELGCETEREHKDSQQRCE